MSSKKVDFKVLDLSAQLRYLMASERLSVSELAQAAGVSKSAMEKYLAGPSSPRATAVASLCANLGLSIEWLLFGYSDNDRLRVRDFVTKALHDIIFDLKNDPTLSAQFEGHKANSKEFSTFALGVAMDQSELVAARVWEARKKSMKDYAAGHREAVLQIMPFSKDESEQ